MQRPKCSNCQRRNEKCSFSLDAQQLQLPVALIKTGPPTLVANLPALNLEDLELLHHFSTEVYATLSARPAVRRVWQKAVPKDAVTHPHLMHCILAISALHLANQEYEGQDSEAQERYRRAALRHEAAAISLCWPLLNHVTAANCQSLFTSGWILGIFTAARNQVSDMSNSDTVIEGVLAIGQQARGVYAVLDACDQWLRSGEFDVFLRLNPWDDAPPIVPDIDEALQAIYKTIEASLEYDEARRSMYSAAIKLLRFSFQAPTVNPQYPTVVFSWLSFMDRNFVGLMEQKDAMALVILAHYGVLLHTAASWWWCGDLGARLVKSIYDSLEQSRHLLTWPVSKVEISVERNGSCGTVAKTQKSCDRLKTDQPSLSRGEGLENSRGEAN